MPAHLRTEPMSKVDADFYYIDLRTNMMMITGVMLFDEPVDFNRLRDTFRYRMLERYPRFRMRIRERGPVTAGFNGPVWEEDPGFDIAAHVHRVALPSPGGRAALQDLAGDLVSTPLDYDRPPWQIHLVEGYCDPEGEGRDAGCGAGGGAGCAVIWRFSHCICDGAAIMQVVLDIADEGPNAAWPEPVETHEYRAPLLTRLIVPAASAVDSTLRLAETAVHEGRETLSHPERLAEPVRAGARRAVDAAKFGVAWAWTLSRIGLMSFEPRTVFKGKLGVTKRVAWSRPLPLGEVKTVGKVLNGTVNDVVLAAVAGGLRRYLVSRGEKTTGLNLRALVPVNLRGPDERGILGTHAGLTYLSLPVGIEDTQERVAVVHKRMDVIKHSPEGQGTFDMFNLVGLTTPQVTRLFCELFSAKATGIMTNVPGPRQPVYLAGARLAHMLFWVPTAAGISLGVGICSYDGNVVVGIQTAASLVPDPGSIVSAIEADFDNMLDYVRYVREDPALA